MSRAAKKAEIYRVQINRIHQAYLRACLEKSIIIRENINSLTERELRILSDIISANPGQLERSIDRIIGFIKHKKL